MGLFCYRHSERIAVATIERKIFPQTPGGDRGITVRSPVCQECASSLKGRRAGGANRRANHTRVDAETTAPDSDSASITMDEKAVENAVCTFLVQNGYVIKSSCSTMGQGIDVCAESPSTGQRIHVEAIGATSPRSRSSRSEKTSMESQVFDQVAKGFYTVLQLNGKADGGVRNVLAMPDSDWFRKYLAPVQPTLEAAGIGLFLVGAGGQIRVFTDFQL